MNYNISAANIEKILKLDIDTLENEIEKVNASIEQAKKEKTIYKLSLYRTALKIVLVSKKQNKDVNLQMISEMINSSSLFMTKTGRNHSSAAPRER